MSYKPILDFKTGEAAGNDQRFATREEALASAASLFMRQTSAIGYGVAPSADSVNYRREGGKDLPMHREAGEALHRGQRS